MTETASLTPSGYGSSILKTAQFTFLNFWSRYFTGNLGCDTCLYSYSKSHPNT